MEPIRVLYYEQPGLGPGGSRVSLQNLVRGLDHRVQAFLVGNFPREVMRELPTWSGVFAAPRLWPPRSPSLFGRHGTTARFLCYLVSTAARLAGIIWRLQIDIVHGNNEVNSNAPAVLAAAITGRPCVCHLRGTLRPRWETRWLYKHVDHFIGICQHVVDYYADQGLLGDTPTSVIYNGLDVSRACRRARSARSPRPGGIRVATFGRLVEFKGHEYFVRAAAEALRDLPEAEFVIHGPIPEDGAEATYYEQVRETARSLDVGGQLHFAGAYDDVADVMAQTDIVVCCSPHDNFGRTLFEAMACGVPVVAFNCGGTDEVAAHEENALLVPNRDCEALGQAIVRLARDEGLRGRLVEEGQRTASSLFDYRTNADRVFQLYERLLGRTPASSPTLT